MIRLSRRRLPGLLLTAAIECLLLPGSSATADECYGGLRRLAEVGDFSTYLDQNAILSTSIVTEESYDATFDVQSVTTQTVGGPSDGNVYFYRNTLHQNLYDGFDRSVLGPGGLVRVSTRYSSPIPTRYPICPGSTQSSEGGALLAAPGFKPCEGSYLRSLVATQWETVSVPIGTFRALRVEEELALAFDPVCGLDPVADSGVVWLAPGAGAVRSDYGGVVRELIDAKPKPTPEPEASALSCIALVSLLMLRSGNARRA